MSITLTTVSETENSQVLSLDNHQAAVALHLAEIADGKTPTVTTEDLLEELNILHDDVSDYDGSNKWANRFFTFDTNDIENLMDELYELADQ
jgi:hypothetical protein